jgi:hypothetical protein
MLRNAASRAFAVLLALALPVAAQDYGVSGEGVAGRASVRPDGTFSLQLTRFSRDGATTSEVSGRVASRSAGELQLSYERVVSVERSILDVIRGIPATRRERVTSKLLATGAGWNGEVDGVVATWVDQSAIGADTVVLVVPGLSTNLWNQYDVPYLDENLAALRARGLSARRLAINTEESIAVNAAAVAREVRAEVARGKKVLLLAHSKGGADTVTALADPANRDLLPHVRGLMTIQPVYGGSPISDLVGTNCLIQASVDQFFERVLPVVNRVDDEGSRDAVRDLRSEARQASLREHPYPVDRVPTVVLRSSFSGRPMFRPRHVLRKPLWVFQKFLEKTKDGLQSDGMVSLEWQRIPGAAAEITLSDMDHFEPGFRGESPHSPCEVTNLLLDRTLEVLGR